uniref:Nucleophosmin/nucleoplasmin 2 n=1 Tax=Otus sunia TaxID=257818 RepID=A0A8C8ABZ1_9STRI
MSLTDSTGCELSSERDSYTFQVPEEWQCEQQLALWTVCLGETARDEFHVVEIVPGEEGDARAPVPLATLKPSVLPMVSATLVGVELTPPATFHLRAGSGPVYISGQHISSKYWVMPNLSWDEEEEEEDAEDEEPAEESPEKPPKGQAAKKGSAAKVSTPLAEMWRVGRGPYAGGVQPPPPRELPHALILGRAAPRSHRAPKPVKGVSHDLPLLRRKSLGLRSESPSCWCVPGPALYIFLSLP